MKKKEEGLDIVMWIQFNSTAINECNTAWY